MQVFQDAHKLVATVEKLWQNPISREVMRKCVASEPGPSNGSRAEHAKNHGSTEAFYKTVVTNLPRLRTELAEFNYNELIDAVEAKGFQFTIKDKRSAANRVLRRLCEERKCTLVQRGVASAPNTYRFN